MCRHVVAYHVTKANFSMPFKQCEQFVDSNVGESNGQFLCANRPSTSNSTAVGPVRTTEQPSFVIFSRATPVGGVQYHSSLIHHRPVAVYRPSPLCTRRSAITVVQTRPATRLAPLTRVMWVVSCHVVVTHGVGWGQGAGRAGAY